MNRNTPTRERKSLNPFQHSDLAPPSEVLLHSRPLTPEMARAIAARITAFHDESEGPDQHLEVVGRASGGSSPALNSRQGADLLLALAEMLGEAENPPL